MKIFVEKLKDDDLQINTKNGVSDFGISNLIKHYSA